MSSETQAAEVRYAVTGENLPGGEAHVVAQGSMIRFDGTALTGSALPGPADLLAGALAACVLKNVERFSKMLHISYRRATIDVTIDREEPPPRIVRARYTLRVETDEPDARVELLHRNIRKFGTITNTVAAAADLQGEIIALRPETAWREGAVIEHDGVDRAE